MFCAGTVTAVREKTLEPQSGLFAVATLKDAPVRELVFLRDSHRKFRALLHVGAELVVHGHRRIDGVQPARERSNVTLVLVVDRAESMDDWRERYADFDAVTSLAEALLLLPSPGATAAQQQRQGSEGQQAGGSVLC